VGVLGILTSHQGPLGHARNNNDKKDEIGDDAQAQARPNLVVTEGALRIGVGISENLRRISYTNYQKYMDC
jgi:hypothetical protein